MRYSPLPPVLALAVLAAGPLLGCGGRVCAGFLVPSPLLEVGPTLDRWAAPEAARWEDAGLSFGLAEGPGPDDPLRGLPNEHRSERRDGQGPDANRLPGWLWHSGGGERGSPGGSGSGVPGLDASMAAPPRPPLAQVGSLFLREHLYCFPPFVSRLFQPPRVAERL
jgi:hypothetical protein